jgi:hypothetical protein
MVAAKRRKGKMNRNYRRVPTEFGPDTRFELKPAIGVFRRTAEENRFKALKAELLFERLNEELGAAHNNPVRRAANEAEALAWVTPYPLLVFPALFEEKAEAALARAQRQEDVFERSRELLAV